MLSLVVIILLVILIGLVIFLLVRPKSAENKKDDLGTLSILQEIRDMRNIVDQKIGDTAKMVNDSAEKQTTRSFELIRDVTEKLTKLDETNRQVVSFADQLQNLQDVLKNPKQRGILGEYYLETLLKNTMSPGSYEMQYKMGTDDTGGDLIVDAAVFVKDKIIPIDSKFSLENYNKMVEEKSPLDRDRLEKLFVSDLKNRIAETSKYIRPQDNTMDFAFMFIPHESIYYDLLVNKVGALKEEPENLIQRAAYKYKVIIVSPTSFLAYLQTVLQGLKALHIEEQAKEIGKRVGELGKHLKTYEEYHTKLGNSLRTTVNHYSGSSKQFKMLDKDIFRITEESPGLIAELLEGPEDDE